MTDVPTNQFKIDARAGKELLGLWLSTGSDTMAELAGYSDYDWFLIDGEHGCNTVTTIQAQLRALQAAGKHAIVRPAATDRVLIKQILDTGAQTLLLPMVNSADEARQAVAAMHYPPRGVRGVGPSIARATRWGRMESYVEQAGDQVCTLIQVESRAAVDNLDQILTVDGIDGVFIGPVDLGASLGYPSKEEMDRLVCSLLGRIRDAGKIPGALGFDTETTVRYLDAGARFVAVASDTVSYVAALDSAVADVRTRRG